MAVLIAAVLFMPLIVVLRFAFDVRRPKLRMAAVSVASALLLTALFVASPLLSAMY